MRVKKDKCRRKHKIVHGSQFAPDLILNVEADNQNLISQFVFELVDDGLYLGAGNSIRGLEFQ